MFAATTSDRRLPAQHPLLRNLEQVATVLRQQVKSVRDVGDVLDVAVFETLEVECFK